MGLSTNRKPRKHHEPPPPIFKVGEVFGNGTIVEYLGVTHRASRQKWQHQYRLECVCGNHFDRWQESLNQARQRGEQPSCGCSANYRREQPAESPTVPCVPHWGYRPDPINPYLARSA